VTVYFLGNVISLDGRNKNYLIQNNFNNLPNFDFLNDDESQNNSSYFHNNYFSSLLYHQNPESDQCSYIFPSLCMYFSSKYSQSNQLYLVDRSFKYLSSVNQSCDTYSSVPTNQSDLESSSEKLSFSSSPQFYQPRSSPYTYSYTNAYGNYSTTYCSPFNFSIPLFSFPLSDFSISSPISSSSFFSQSFSSSSSFVQQYYSYSISTPVSFTTSLPLLPVGWSSLNFLSSLPNLYSLFPFPSTVENSVYKLTADDLNIDSLENIDHGSIPTSQNLLFTSSNAVQNISFNSVTSISSTAKYLFQIINSVFARSIQLLKDSSVDVKMLLLLLLFLLIFYCDIIEPL
jgi:hypothetical protein